MEDFFHVDHLLHDFRLVHISWNPIEHERIDIGFEFVGLDGGVDRFFPKLDRDFVGDELALARVFEESFADLGAGVD